MGTSILKIKKKEIVNTTEAKRILFPLISSFHQTETQTFMTTFAMEEMNFQVKISVHKNSVDDN